MWTSGSRGLGGDRPARLPALGAALSAVGRRSAAITAPSCTSTPGQRFTGATTAKAAFHSAAAGEWLQQATFAIWTRVRLAVLEDVIRPFLTLWEAFLHALLELRSTALALL
jgi:hypothetical protein